MAGDAGARGRKKDSAATKAALLLAARELFAERGFEATTARDIAARAAVNQSMLFRYFGSKDGLFQAAIGEITGAVLAQGPAEGLPARLLTHVLMPDDTAELGNWVQTALRSTGHDGSTSAIRRELGEDFLGALSALTDAPDAALRADLVVAWLMGIALLRSVFEREPLASADPETVARNVLPVISVLLERSDLTFPVFGADSPS